MANSMSLSMIKRSLIIKSHSDKAKGLSRCNMHKKLHDSIQRLTERGKNTCSQGKTLDAYSDGKI